ncbi:WD40-repeat-containing domain protein [Gigaspora rosea]|uniref:WD40-repeat-containing domain protein n=1 Tax=Gigaspora rosea TaxID=44941 RepID=A0A397UKN1_9GLOM|nr:WD40-repeat-containing domain protein [Gigaspora rosea]
MKAKKDVKKKGKLRDTLSNKEKKSAARKGLKKETKSPATMITTNKGKSKAIQVKKNTTKKPEEKKAPQYQPSMVEKAANLYPDNYWKFHAESNTGMINYINEEHKLELINVDVRDQGPITGMTLSPDGAMLVTFCNVGCAKIWDTADFKLIQKLRDTEEVNIDEFFVGKFIPDHSRMAIGGKLKDRHHWSKDDDDNHILPCPLKIFDVITGKVITRLEGHTEEILCVKTVIYKGAPYFLTTSQDGYIIKWKMRDDWTTLISKQPMVDGLTCMAFTVSFVPNTANRYFMAATDEHVRLYDFDAAQLMQTFSGNMYSQYCDCGKFIYPVEPLEDEDINNDSVEEYNSKSKKKQVSQKFAYFITRGVEILDAEGGKIASRANVSILHKLIYPSKKGQPFELKEVRRFGHKDYHSNSWLIKISSNGRYLVAPTMTGHVFIFSLRTGKVTAILRDHEDLEVRDVIFHPWKPLLFTSADDGCIKIYTYKN